MTQTVQKKSNAKKIIRIVVLVVLTGAGLFYLGYSLLLQHKVNALTAEDKKVLIIGHAGSGFLSPLNPFNPLPASSLTSILKALGDGADGVEVDVQLSKDGVLVLYHDEKLESMTSANGRIEDLPAKQVLGLTYQAGFGYDLFQNEKIVAFETLLQKLQAYPEYPLLHVDLRNYEAQRHSFYASTVLELLSKYNYPLQKVSFISPDATLLQAFRRLQPNVTLLVDRNGNFENTLQIAMDSHMDGMTLNAKDVTEKQMQIARSLQMQVVLFGPKASSSIYKAIKLQPDAIEVNNVEAMYEMLR